MNIEQLPTASLKPNDYNFNQMEAEQLKALARDVRKRGYIMHHIVARKVGDDLVIIDGEHQWKAAVEAGLETVPVQVVESNQADAIADTYRRNGLRGETNRLKLARAIRRMQQEGKDEQGKPMANTKAAKALGRTEGWVRTTLMYADLADMLAGKAGALSEDDIARMTETDVRDMLATLRNPEAHNANLFEEGQAEGQAKGEDDVEAEDDKKPSKVDRIIKQLAKMEAGERAEVHKVLGKLVREDTKRAKEQPEQQEAA